MGDGERRDPRCWLCVVSGVIERDGALLLVRQRSKHDPEEGYWVLPGGVVEADETLELALQREVFEETGLRVERPGRLLCIVETTSSIVQGLTFIFDVTCNDVATPGGLDPDGLVKEAAWVPRTEALARLAALPFPRMADPLAAVLSGRAPEGSIWTYEADANGVDQLRSTIPG